MTYIEDLETIRDQTASKLAAHMTGEIKPTYSVDGRSFDWTGYRRELRKQLEDINMDIIRAGGPATSSTIALG